MAEDEQQMQPLPEQQEKKRHTLRNVLLSLVVIIGVLIAALAIMFSTDKGSRFLLDRVLSHQKMIQYQYESGNLLQGIILKNILVSLKPVDIKIDRADVSLGWRAILDKEIHLSHADINNLRIITKLPSSHEPFKFSEIKLPFVLRIDHATLDHLAIQVDTTTVDFHDIELNQALWSGTSLTFENTKMDMGYLAVKGATGSIQFEGKYPIDAKGIVSLPSLQSLNIQEIYIRARGTLDTIRVGVATKTPDLLTGWAVVHPMRPQVPMNGALIFKNYHWPLLLDQKLLSKQGVAKFAGNVQGLDLEVNTDISGQNIPEGKYTAKAHTDLIHQLNINQLNGQLMGGAVDIAGLVSWQEHIHWDLNGRLDRISPKDKIIPQVVRDFLPPSLDAKIASTGVLKKDLQVIANVAFDKFETWNLKLNQAEQKTKKPEPLLLDVDWKNIDRAVPYIGWLSSDSGKVKLALLEGQQNIQVTTSIAKHDQAMLPAGQYNAQLNLKDNNVNIPTLSYLAEKGSLTGSAQLQLPDAKRQLKWKALLTAKDFNPQTVVATAPINLLSGQINANGFARTNEHIIQLASIDLTGRIANQVNPETVKLTGKSTVAVFFKDEKSGGGFKSFGVQYDGALNATQMQQGNGLLKFKVAGTPELIKIYELKHNGVAGQVLASGSVYLNQAIIWDINASLVHFKPYYFVSSIRGELSGNLKTQGTWSEKLKRINIQRLNLAGMINNKPLRGRGNLAVVLNADQKGLLPQQFEANNLFLSYANNQLQATGNAQNLKLNLNAPALYELYPGLRGKAYGYLNLQAQPRLSATANLMLDDFGFNDAFSIKKISLKGELPTSETIPAKMVAQLETLRSGGREIQHAAATLSGTRKAHLLQLQGWNYYSKFYVQLVGGFNGQSDWLGQIQKGEFDSIRMHLLQDQNAPVIFTAAKSELYVGQHCWSSQQSQLCFDQPIRVNSSRGNVSFLTKNLDLNDFSAFMPEGLAMTGKLNGYAKASWAQGTQPKLDARLVTRNGEIGLAAAVPEDLASTMHYDEASIIVKSVKDGLLLRTDLKAPNIGTGYANVFINPYVASKPMRGEVAFNEVQLKILKPFIADVRKMNGSLALAGKISGTLTQPLFNGEMRLKNGAISMISLPVDLTNIQIYSSIQQNHATLNGAFNSGQGVGVLKGNIDWKDDPRIQLNLTGDKLLVRQVPLLTALVNTDVAVDILPVNKKIIVKGKVVVPRALISMPEASASVINVSPDVRVVHEGDDQLAILKAAKPWDIRADVDVSLGNQVVFQGFNSRIPLVGRVYLSQRGLETAMRANGAIGVSQKVTIEAYGQTLDLNRAIARFNGPLANPTLDVDVNKSISGSIVGVRVLGTATSPNIQVYNDAGLSEQEAMNALLTGRINEGSSGLNNTEGFKSDVNNTIAAAGISLGLGGTRAFTNQIGRNFGLSGLALDAQGTGDDTQVSLTGYITPDLYIRYGVGVFTPVNKLTLRYQMNKRLYLEASQSLEKAIDVFYHWRF
ncbi:translocation/assembly module TamB domain-containing protein [Acinetobacter sp. ANC 4648]|uniref:translocation/assembly module TamB domain-containing protein n=1 Tax=Acinetobacter sp. ANC 4648 TaxID=1977875 RepID=UPI000A342F44|nr:translocation/assembly module TamB domain-containing protein [Acinetobacter sp. ANC 4648]OTG83036.1 hypothetical protein B9T27_07130 [Acinetobacter sp. ANC 4648]